jgi:hypothetical protein
MKFLANGLFAAVFALSFSTLAFADDAPPAAPGAGHGHMMACKADAEKLCPGLKGKDMGKCMHDNKDKVSKPCADEMAKMHSMHGGAPPPTDK